MTLTFMPPAAVDRQSIAEKGSDCHNKFSTGKQGVIGRMPSVIPAKAGIP
jgi:hypothetical protein